MLYPLLSRVNGSVNFLPLFLLALRLFKGFLWDTRWDWYKYVFPVIASCVSGLSQQCVPASTCLWYRHTFILILIVNGRMHREPDVLSHSHWIVCSCPGSTMLTWFITEEYANKSVIITRRNIAICLNTVEWQAMFSGRCNILHIAVLMWMMPVITRLITQCACISLSKVTHVHTCMSELGQPCMNKSLYLYSGNYTSALYKGASQLSHPS